MQTFKDKTGQEWPLELNVAAARRLKGHGIDVMQALEDRTGNLLVELTTNPIKLVDTLYIVLQPVAEERGITDEQFGEIFDGPAIDAATQALLAEFADFFPKARRAMKHAIAKLDEVNEKAQDLAIEQINQNVAKGLKELVSPNGPGG